LPGASDVDHPRLAEASRSVSERNDMDAAVLVLSEER
jgi:hypothetical protein